MEYKGYNVEILDEEYWYGPIVNDGVIYPLHKESIYEVNMEPHSSPNQANTMLASTKGRVVWCESGFKLKVAEGVIRIDSCKAEVGVYEMGNCLKDAYLGAAKKFFTPNGIVPPEDFFVKPQYNTWIELLYHQNQQGILDYVDNIIKNDMPVGIIMIDDGWNEYYGNFKFHKEKFPDPKTMVDKLHKLGFRVMLWTCPFISPDSQEFRYLKDKGYLVRNQDGSVAIREWWNGYSAVLDLTHPGAVEWYNGQNKYLMDEYGIDGFKFDAGDAVFYRDEDLTYEKVDANGQSELWAKLGLAYEFNEYRACFKMAGTHLVQRLADKGHSWMSNGVASLVPNELAQGILGYAYTCPDMIGGGEYQNFLANSHNLDQELFVRYAQCAALMPMMQFSAAPWRVLDEEYFGYCKEAAWLHVEYADYIYELAQEASRSGAPIVRYMAYEFPHQGFEQITDQFMLGDKYLVAPVIAKGASTRTVVLPAGEWMADDQSIIEGPVTLSVEAPLGKLPVFELMD